MTLNALGHLAIEKDIPFSSKAITFFENVAQKVSWVNFDELFLQGNLSDADGIICSWKTELSESRLTLFPGLKYIGLRCTSLDRVDISAVRRRSIELRNIQNYGDFGTAEFVIEQILRHFRPSNDLIREIRGKNLGIVGLGNVGELVRDRARGLGMKVSHFSNSKRKNNWVPLADLLANSDVISFHSPSYTKIVTASELRAIKPSALVIVTTLGLPFDLEEFSAWIVESKTTVIVDLCAASGLENELATLQGVEVWPFYAARTLESIARAEKQVIGNLANYINSPKTNRIPKAKNLPV